MHMARYTPTFENVAGLSVVSVPAREVPRGLWAAFQAAERELVRRQIAAALPAGVEPGEAAAQLYRATEITSHGDAAEFARRQRFANSYRGIGGTNRRQLYHDPRTTLVFDTHNDSALAAAIATVRNTSPSPSVQQLPEAVGNVEQWLKMHAAPWVPRLGGHRYEKVTDVVFVDEPAAALAGLRHALDRRPRADQVALYHVPNDPADEEMGWVVDTVGLRLQNTTIKSGMAGYPDGTSLGRYTAPIGSVIDQIDAYPGATQAIHAMHVLDAIPPRWQDTPYPI